MSHLFFIAASYGVALVGLGALTLWSIAAYRREQRTLAELEARGVRRRARATTAAQDAAAKATPEGDAMGVK